MEYQLSVVYKLNKIVIVTRGPEINQSTNGWLSPGITLLRQDHKNAITYMLLRASLPDAAFIVVGSPNAAQHSYDGPNSNICPDRRLSSLTDAVLHVSSQ